MSDPTPTELAENLAKWRRHGAVILERETLRSYATIFANAFEAQLAETARLQAVIDGMRRIVFDPVSDYYGEIREKFDALVASAGSSSALEAVKADTTTEWGVRWVGTQGEPVTDIGATPDDIFRLVEEQEGFAEAVNRQVTEWVPVETEGESRG